jgi:hypothetical protein
MDVYFLPSHSLLWVYSQTSLDKIFCLLWYANFIVFWERIFDGLKDFFISKTLKRVLAVDKLIKDNSKRPNIGFSSVGFLLVYLRSHCLASPKECSSQAFLFNLLCKTEICDLTVIFMQKYVCSFEISMHGIDLMESFESIDDLFDETNSFCFG